MKALILEYAIKREVDIKPIYRYDFEKGLNMITVGDKTIPLLNHLLKIFHCLLIQG